MSGLRHSQYWRVTREENEGDLKFAENLWTEMIEKGEDLNPC